MKRSAPGISGNMALVTVILCCLCESATAADVETPANTKDSVANAISVDGAELFAREWIPGDTRSHGGDGLGPLFNDSSCVACHNQGGNGGAGPLSKNVDIITAFELPVHVPDSVSQHQFAQPSLVNQVITSMFGELDGPAAPESEADVTSEDVVKAREVQMLEMKKNNRAQLISVHPGFSQGNSIVLHNDATFAGYREWREQMAIGQISSANTNQFELFNSDSSKPSSQRRPSFGRRRRPSLGRQQLGTTMQTQFGNFTMTRSQRNATALFGAGLIDSVKKETLEAIAAEQAKDGEVSGRVSTLADNKIGRFGWKGQTASLSDFVMTACAVEVGLNVPNHPQSGLPQSPEYRAKGLDLNQKQCDALINYVASLPAPAQRDLPSDVDKKYVHDGKLLFAKIGCAKCHVENVGDITGIFSDLLLHDMGDELGDSGTSYGIFIPDSTPNGDLLTNSTASDATDKVVIGATRKEWRTPALWGVRDSAPYLHDGRADDLIQAIALHGGESQTSSNAFFTLTDAEQFQVVTFLKSLVAPSSDAQSKQVASIE